MKKIALSLLFAVVVWPASAQTSSSTGGLNPETERARIAAERQTLEARIAIERAACYQKFAVEDCLSDSRKRARRTSDDLKRQEAALNELERKRRAAAQLEKIEEKAAPQRQQDLAAERERAGASQKAREERAANHANSRQSLAAEEADRQRQFAAKQKAHADEQAKLARQQAMAPVLAREHEEKLQKAAQHRADVERRNAQRDKPRSAPLPPPP